MSAFEAMNYINFVLAVLGMGLYYYNATRCQTPHWKIYKYMLGSNLGIMALIYLMYISHFNVEPIIVRLNTTLLLILMICNAILGRSKYGRRY